MTTLESRFLTILSEHRGLSKAIAVPELARKLGVPERQARSIKRDLVDQGHLVGSSCTAGKSGYYLIVNEEEVRATYQNYASRWSSLGKLMQCMKKNAGQVESPQLIMF